MTSSAKSHVTATGMIVEPHRIDTMDAHLFRPFRVKSTQPLATALDRGLIEPDRDVLVAEIPNCTMVLDKAQMSYHHTAQGEYRGQPWVVCF